MIPRALAFQASDGNAFRRGATPEPGRDPAPPEREWGLSAGQVTLAVLLILAACEAIALIG